MEVEITELDDGLRVVSAALPRVESVAVGLWVGVGARHEQPRVSGVSHFIEHLLFKGTRKRSARDISRAIEGRGGYLNAFTQEESTCYYARVAFNQLARAMDVLCDMYRDPRFDPAELDKERGVVIEEIMMYRDQPHHEVQDMLGRIMWANHPLGRPIIGSPESIQALTRADVASFKERNYVPANTLVAFAGKLEHGRCVERARELLGGMAGERPDRPRRVTAKTRQDRVAVTGKDIEQAHLAIGVRIFGRHDKRRYPLRVLNAVLGENMSSRLFQEVREKHGLAYSVHSSTHLFEDSGGLIVSAGIDRKRKQKALSLIVREMRKLKDRPVGKSELKRAREYVIGQLRLALESTTNQMMWAGEHVMWYGENLSPEEAIREFESVTAEDVQAVAQQLLRPDCTSIAMIGPGLSDQDRGWLEAGLDGV